jgi:hypothetical protein
MRYSGPAQSSFPWSVARFVTDYRGAQVDQIGKGMQMRLLASLALLFSAALLGPLVASSARADPSSSENTIGLVLTVWDLAIRETPDSQECPQGLQYTEKEQWLALSEEERTSLNERFGLRWSRGPSGENGIMAPAGMRDPLPFREVQSEVAYGFDLDGTRDGHATAQSCAHQKFTDLDTGEAVDHQMYRVLGCAQGARTGGFQREWVKTEFQTQPINRILLEIVGVDNERNDGDVQVHFYKGFDGLAVDSAGEFLPGATHRIDRRFPPLFSATGKIVDGMLTTDSVPMASFPIKWINQVGTRNIRDMQLRLKLAETGAKGFIGGYEDIKDHWNMWRRGASGSQDLSAWSGASIYQAMNRLADGYPNPRTGQCTAISMAYSIEAARANIVHSPTSRPVGQSAHDVSLSIAERELKGY